MAFVHGFKCKFEIGLDYNTIWIKHM